MRIGAALSTDLDPAKATTEAAEEARVRLGGPEVSLAVLVTSRDHAPFAEVASKALRVEVGPERVIGCVAETVVGGDREVECGPAIAVWLASLPEPPRLPRRRPRGRAPGRLVLGRPAGAGQGKAALFAICRAGRNDEKCIHPRRARPFAHSPRSIRCGIFAGYSAFESRFKEPIDQD
jgi:hypothetical protein